MFGVRLTQLTAEERETQTNPAQPFGISGKFTPACKQTARKVAVRLTPFGLSQDQHFTARQWDKVASAQPQCQMITDC